MPRHRCSIYTVTMRQTEEEDRICRICGHFIYPVLPFLPPPPHFSISPLPTRKRGNRRWREILEASESIESNLNVNTSSYSLLSTWIQWMLFRKEGEEERENRSELQFFAALPLFIPFYSSNYSRTLPSNFLFHPNRIETFIAIIRFAR